MKKILASIAIISIFLANSAFAKSEIITEVTKDVAKKTEIKQTSEEKISEKKEDKDKNDEIFLNAPKDIRDIKTFDFERIFKEVDAYSEAAANWQILKCYPKTRFLCSKRECPKLKITDPAAIILNKKDNTVAACSNNVCEYFGAKFEELGVFVHVKINDSYGVIIKILGNNRYKQIALIGLDAYISNGECEVIKNK